MNEKGWKTLVKEALFDGLDPDGDFGCRIFQFSFNFVTSMKDRAMIFSSKIVSDLRKGHVQL